MKALTVWQPWASLIIAGAKPYEFRGWRAPRSIIGQRIVIHAGARKPSRFEVIRLLGIHRFRENGGVIERAARESCLLTELALPVLTMSVHAPEQLPMACGIGTAVVGELRLGTEIAEEFGVPRANDSDRDEHANWGWPMLDIEPWPEPVSMRGAQGLWNWPDAFDFTGGVE